MRFERYRELFETRRAELRKREESIISSGKASTIMDDYSNTNN